MARVDFPDVCAAGSRNMIPITGRNGQDEHKAYLQVPNCQMPKLACLRAKSCGAVKCQAPWLWQSLIPHAFQPVVADYTVVVMKARPILPLPRFISRRLRCMVPLPRPQPQAARLKVAAASSSFLLPLSPGCFLLIYAILNYAVEIPIPPCQEQHVVRGDRGPTSVSAKAFQIRGHRLCEDSVQVYRMRPRLSALRI